MKRFSAYKSIACSEYCTMRLLLDNEYHTQPPNATGFGTVQQSDSDTQAFCRLLLVTFKQELDEFDLPPAFQANLVFFIDSLIGRFHLGPCLSVSGPVELVKEELVIDLTPREYDAVRYMDLMSCVMSGRDSVNLYNVLYTLLQRLNLTAGKA